MLRRISSFESPVHCLNGNFQVFCCKTFYLFLIRNKLVTRSLVFALTLTKKLGFSWFSFIV